MVAEIKVKGLNGERTWPKREGEGYKNRNMAN